MQITHYDKSFIDISSYIRSGLQHPAGIQSLTLRKTGGDGLLWAMELAGETYWAWCNAEQWYDWLAPVLSLDDIDLLPEELTKPVVAFVQPVFDILSESPRWQYPVRGSINTRWYPVLTLRRDNLKLSCVLIDWPLELIREISTSWEPVISDPEENECIWNAPLLLGWRTLNLTELQQCKLGDGLCIDQIPDIGSGEIWLSIPHKRILLSKVNQGEFRVENIVNDTENRAVEETDVGKLYSHIEYDDSSMSIHPLDNIPVTLSVEIGQLSVPVKMLTSIKPGDSLPANTFFNDEVRLLLAGVCVAKGSLLQVSEKLVVKITEIYHIYSR